MDGLKHAIWNQDPRQICFSGWQEIWFRHRICFWRGCCWGCQWSCYWSHCFHFRIGSAQDSSTSSHSSSSSKRITVWTKFCSDPEWKNMSLFFWLAFISGTVSSKYILLAGGFLKMKKNALVVQNSLHMQYWPPGLFFRCQNKPIDALESSVLELFKLMPLPLWGLWASRQLWPAPTAGPWLVQVVGVLKPSQ